MQSQGNHRLTFSVSTSVEDTSFYSSIHSEQRDEWVFRHVVFYALPPKSHEQLNTWIMMVAQFNVTNGRWRYLRLDPIIEDDGRITGSHIESTNNVPPSGTIAEFKLEEKIFMTQGEGETSPHQVHYFHYELMAHLRDGFTQALLLPKHHRQPDSILLELYVLLGSIWGG